MWTQYLHDICRKRPCNADVRRFVYIHGNRTKKHAMAAGARTDPKKHFETVNFILGHFVNFLEEIYQEKILDVRSPLKGSPSAEPSLCFLKDIITKFCFINSILTKDISIESSFKVAFVFTAAINSKRVLNFPWLGNSLIFKNAISDVTCKYDYLNISSFPVKAVIWKEERPFILFFFSLFFFCYGSHEFTFTRII